MSTSGVSGANLFNQLNTNNSTVTQAEEMGYPDANDDFWADADPTWKAEMFAEHQFLDENEINTALKSGALTYQQVELLDSSYGGDGKITEEEFSENIADAQYVVENPTGEPAEGIGSSNEFEQVICADLDIQPTYSCGYFTSTWGQISVLETPEVTLVDDATNVQGGECNLTITVNDPSQVRIGYIWISCTGFDLALDTNNDGAADIVLDQAYARDPSSVNIVIGNQTVNLQDFMNEHQGSGFDGYNNSLMNP